MIKSNIDASSVLPIVEELVQIKSENPGCDEYGVTEYIKNFMEELSVPVELVPVNDRRINVVARMKGEGKTPPIAFTGHMDVVPVNPNEAHRWKTNPYEPTVIDGHLYGRGSSDMKGGLGAAMAAMRMIKEHGEIPPGDVLLIATVDEEDLMRGAKALIQTSMFDDVKELIVCEPTDLKIVVSGRGRSWAKVTLHGESAHASIENNGNNAIMQAVALIDKLKESQHRVSFTPHPQLGNFFWQTTMIQGGTESVIVPDSCVMIVDTRSVPGQTNKEIWDVFRDLLRELENEYKGFSASVEIIEEREPWEIDMDASLVNSTKRCCEKLGIPVSFDSANYTTDGCYFSKRGMQTVIFGPGSIAQAHKENEYVSISQLEKAANFYYTLMMDGER